MWVEAARRWAAKGVPTFRVDVEGIGDAEGDAGIYRDVGRFYTPDRGAHVRSIIDALQARGSGARFVLIGLCAGAYSAFQTAAVDERVVASVVLNPRALVWDPELLGRRDARLVSGLLEPSLWRRVLRGETGAARLLRIARAVSSQTVRAVTDRASRLRQPRRVAPWTEQMQQMLDRLRDRNTRVVIAFSGDEPVHDELRADGVMTRLDDWPNLVVRDLPGDDHTLRPIEAQRAAHELLDGELQRLMNGTEAVSRASP
jgi:hypothetical protein